MKETCSEQALQLPWWQRQPLEGGVGIRNTFHKNLNFFFSPHRLCRTTSEEEKNNLFWFSDTFMMWQWEQHVMSCTQTITLSLSHTHTLSEVCIKTFFAVGRCTVHLTAGMLEKKLTYDLHHYRDELGGVSSLSHCLPLVVFSFHLRPWQRLRAVFFFKLLLSVTKSNTRGSFWLVKKTKTSSYSANVCHQQKEHNQQNQVFLFAQVFKLLLW